MWAYYVSLITFLEIEVTAKQLADTREKLVRIVTGQHNIRGKEKKLEALHKSIADLELKLSMLNNHDPTLVAASSTTEREGTDPRPPSVRIIQSALGFPATPDTTSFMTIDTKQEELETIFPPKGPGSKEDPMEVEFDVAEM